MSNVTIETEAPAAAQSDVEVKPKKMVKRAKAAKTRKATGNKPAAKPRRKRAHKTASETGNKKTEVIAMMSRGKGAPLAEIVAVTGWQKHTVRGFVSILRNKGGHNIESSKNAAGERTYKIAR